MEQLELIVDENKRLDAWLSAKMEGHSRSFVQKLIESGGVSVNGTTIQTKKHKVKVGDMIKVEVPEPEPLDVVPEDIPIDIVYEDDHLMIINKPVGMVVHPAPGNYTGTLVNALMFHVDKLSSINGVIRPGIVHRIDKDTSGLLMIAKTDVAHHGLADQLKEHTIKRQYIAITHGRINEETGTINAPIARHPKDRLKMGVVEGGRRAVTHFEVLERYKNYTYIQCELETGRTHQIRVHMNYIHHPLLGDELYGPKQSKIKHKGQLLHAKTLGFVHPVTEEYMEFDSEVPELFHVMFKKIRGVEQGR